MQKEVAVALTPGAVAQAKRLQAKENKGQYLRIFVTGGGCSGMSYGMSFVDEIEEGDTVVEFDGLKVLVDEFSIPMLQGTTVDFEEGLMGSGFTLHNPNAKATCGCGHSFHT